MTIPWLRLSTRVAHFLGVTLPEETDFHVGVEAWGRGDYDTAVREFRLLAEQGHAQAQVNLGIMSSQGRGVFRKITSRRIGGTPWRQAKVMTWLKSSRTIWRNP